MKQTILAAGIASHTGIIGSAGLPFMKNWAIGVTKNTCIRNIPNDSLLMSAINFGVLVCFMHVNRVKAPNDDMSRFGVQNSHAYSIMERESGVSVADML